MAETARFLLRFEDMIDEPLFYLSGVQGAGVCVLQSELGEE
jgi:hypothetical protein